jgi:hypothetical protein
MTSLQSEELIDDRIASLRSELENYGQDVVHLVQAIYGNHALGPKFDLKNSPFQMISLLKQEVMEMVKLSQDHSAFFQQHQEELKHCQHLSDVLSRVTSVIDHINIFEKQLSGLKLRSCCQQLALIDEEIAQLPRSDSPLGAGKVCSSLRNEKKLLRSRFIAKLRRLLSEAITCENGSIVVHKQLSGYLRSEDKVVEEAVSLADIWTSVMAVECTQQILDAQLGDIWNLIILPLWKEKKVQSPNITTSPDRAEFTLGSVARGISDWSHLEQEPRG